MGWADRGSAGISKVVRPLQIEDHLCMWRRGGSTTGNVWQLVESKCMGTDAVRSDRAGLAPDPPGKEREWLRETRTCRAKANLRGHLVRLSECLCSLRTRPTTRWKVVRPRNQLDRQCRHWASVWVHFCMTVSFYSIKIKVSHLLLMCMSWWICRCFCSWDTLWNTGISVDAKGLAILIALCLHIILNSRNGAFSFLCLMD